MRKCLLLMVVIVAFAGIASAAEPGAGAAGAAEAGGKAADNSAWFFTAVAVASVLGLAVAATGCGIAQGNAVARAVESIARQPESANRILTLSMIGLAFIESLTIYVLVVALILIYANPFVSYIVG
jgi:F-type H+-transporting ATPase subunit c